MGKGKKRVVMKEVGKELGENMIGWVERDYE